MTEIDDVSRARAIEACAKLVREYAGSEANKAAANLLGHLIEAYKADLVTTTPEQLPAIQSKIVQLQSLRRCLLGSDTSIPRV